MKRREFFTLLSGAGWRHVASISALPPASRRSSGRPPEHRRRTSGAPISSHTPTPRFSYSLTLLRVRCLGSWRGYLFAWAAGWRQGCGSPPWFQSGSRKTGWPREGVTGAIALPWALRGLGAFRERQKVMWRDRRFRSMRRVASTVGTVEPLRPREHVTHCYVTASLGRAPLSPTGVERVRDGLRLRSTRALHLTDCSAR
jgi:hypothetical protein